MSYPDFFPQLAARLHSALAITPRLVTSSAPGVGASTWLRDVWGARTRYVDTAGCTALDEVIVRISLARPTAEDVIVFDHIAPTLVDTLFDHCDGVPELVDAKFICNTSAHDRAMVRFERPDPEAVRAWAAVSYSHHDPMQLADIVARADHHPGLIHALAMHVTIFGPGDLDEAVKTSSRALGRGLWDTLEEDTRQVIAALAMFQAPIEGPELAWLSSEAGIGLHAMRELLVSGWIIACPPTSEGVPRYRLHAIARAAACSSEDSASAHVAIMERWCAAWLDAVPRDLLALGERLPDVDAAWTSASARTDLDSRHVRAVVSWMMSMASRSTMNLGEEALEQPSVNIEELVMASIARRDLPAATRMLDGAVSDGTPDREVALGKCWAAIAKVHRSRGEFVLATECYERAADLSRTSKTRRAKYLWRVVECARVARMRERATRALDAFEALDVPGAAGWRIALTRAKLASGVDDARAREQLAIVLAEPNLSPTDRASAQMLLGDVRARALDFGAAARAYELARSLDPLAPSPGARLYDLELLHGLPAAPSPTGDDLVSRTRYAAYLLRRGSFEGALNELSAVRADATISEQQRLMVSVVLAALDAPTDGTRDWIELVKRTQAWSEHDLTLLEIASALVSAEVLPEIKTYDPDATLCPAISHVLASLDRGPRALGDVPDGCDLVCSKDAARARVRGGARIDLSRKHTARRLLRVMIERHSSTMDTRSLTFDELFEQGWPGQSRIAPAAARNRLRVAIRRLRDLGLDGLVVTTGDGYMIDPDAHVMLSDD